MEATGSAALRSRLAVAPVGGPGGRALVADPRNCPILSSRSCSRRSRSTSSGFRAAPYKNVRGDLRQPYEDAALQPRTLAERSKRGGVETFTLLLPILQEDQRLPSTTTHRNQATQHLEDGSARGEAERAQPDQAGISRMTKGTSWSFNLAPCVPNQAGKAFRGPTS